jgi:uncharacterized protein (DUF1684 family)
MTSRAFAAFALLLFASTLLPATAQTSEATDLDHWRKAYADNLDEPNGWLTLVALQWLPDGDTTVGSAPDNKLPLKHLPAHLGTFRHHNSQIEFLAPPEGLSPSVLVDGKHLANVALSPDDSSNPSLVTSGDVSIAVIHRGDRYYLRVKDAYAPTRIHFRGLNWYVPNPTFRITARWVPYTPARTLHILNVLGQASEEQCPGYAEFQIDGKTYKLEPLVEGDSLFFDFRDLTSRSTTDGVGRFLNTGLPSNGLDKPGNLVIDFNYAHNPPCGYTPYATCPLPTEANRLPVAIPAGEKRYD